MDVEKEKEKKQVIFESKVLRDLQKLYPEEKQLSKIINQAVAEFVAKEKLIRMQEQKLIEASKNLGLPTDILQAHLISKALGHQSAETTKKFLTESRQEEEENEA